MAVDALTRPFLKCVANDVGAVRNHYHGLREACPALLGIALFDHLEAKPQNIAPAEYLMWERREIENYICSKATLEAYALASATNTDAAPGPLFIESEAENRLMAMREAIEEIESALKSLDEGSPWGK